MPGIIYIPLNYPNTMSLSDRIKTQRKNIGITQRELAKEADVSYASIQAYERGQIPKGDYLLSIATVLQCATDWLLTGKEYIPQDNSPGVLKEAEVSKSDTALGNCLAEVGNNDGSGLKQSIREFGSVKEKLGYIMNKGNANDRLLVRGFIDQIYENVKENKNEIG